ncbi:MAG: arginine--tRNA ligase [Acidobacteriota bacterium]
MVHRIETALSAAIRRRFHLESPRIAASSPPDPALGDLAFPVCFELARSLRRPPREIAREVAEDLGRIPGVARAEVAGAGYVNAFLDRPRWLLELLADPGAPPPSPGRIGKVIVEHTNINPNKAAHVGHLRNAVLGDTLVRSLRYLGHQVEVQNYIDDTGVQVADLVVGFEDLDVDAPAQVARQVERFDYFCWDLYARVTALFAERPGARARRGEVLQCMEKGNNPTAALAEEVVRRVVSRHLETMARIGVHYDLLPRESDILHLHFWKRAFALLRERGAIHLIQEGRNAGCWVMDLADDPEFADIQDTQKVLVRSDGTVTYTGKDIAYQLWKFGLLGQDFHYLQFRTDARGRTLWITTSGPGEPNPPSFGHGSIVYNVIDRRQAYPQKIVAKGLACLGHHEQGRQSHHFAYEMVGLTPSCARELGQDVGENGRQRSYVEMAGRRGLGVKADDLLDRLLERATQEVRKRNPDMEGGKVAAIAERVAAGALRYFMLRFTRNRVIAFDFGEVLAFEGETGPYVQYSLVRANNILKKFSARHETPPDSLESLAPEWLAAPAPEPPSGEWTVARSCALMGSVVAESVQKQEMAGIARYAFTMAQIFNTFYHRFPVLAETDRDARQRRILLVRLFCRTMTRLLGLMGIEVPPRM